VVGRWIKRGPKEIKKEAEMEEEEGRF